MSDEKRAARAEAKAFRPGVKGAKSSKNRGSQISLALALGGTLVGGSLMLVGSYVGFALLVVGIPATVGIGVWCLRHWDY